MIHVTGGTSLSIDDATRVGAGVTEGLSDDANVIFGARLEPDIRDEIRVMSIVTGVKARLGQGGKVQTSDEPWAKASVPGIESW
jgi:cell division protein FtsZ